MRNKKTTSGRFRSLKSPKDRQNRHPLGDELETGELYFRNKSAVTMNGLTVRVIPCSYGLKKGCNGREKDRHKNAKPAKVSDSNLFPRF